MYSEDNTMNLKNGQQCNDDNNEMNLNQQQCGGKDSELDLNQRQYDMENKKSDKGQGRPVKSENNPSDGSTTKGGEEADNIKEMGTMSMAKGNDRIQIVQIIGQIEGHNIANNQVKSTKYEHIIPQLIAIERDDNVKGVLVVLNTAGGDVEAGLAIAEMITSLSKPTVSIVIGGGHSIGVPLATSADYSFITPSATMIVHPIRMNGFIIGVPQTFEYFRKMQDRIVDFVVRTSDISGPKFRELMSQTDELLNDIGTILIGRQAVDCGLINEVGGIRQALDKLDELIDAKEDGIGSDEGCDK